jgi:hypothetical protein
LQQGRKLQTFEELTGIYCWKKKRGTEFEASKSRLSTMAKKKFFKGKQGGGSKGGSSS